MNRIKARFMYFREYGLKCTAVAFLAGIFSFMKPESKPGSIIYKIKHKVFLGYLNRHYYADCENKTMPKSPEENRYRIRWFDSGRGSIRRRGGNEDFLKRGARFSGEPNRLNETAFILKPGQSGTVCCNNRFSSWHGQWYEEYRIYFVSAVRPDRNMFVREPDFRYEQLAVLF